MTQDVESDFYRENFCRGEYEHINHFHKMLKKNFFLNFHIHRFANKKAYVILYGVVGCFFSATYAYFNGTITTLEKRYKIPSRNTGIISVGNDISSLFVSAALR